MNQYPFDRRTRWCLAVAAVAFAVTTVWAGPGAHGPNGEHLDAPAAVNVSGLARLPDGSVNVPKLAQRRMGILTALAPESEGAATVELPGRVVMDPNSGGRVQVAHGGRIEAGPRGLPVAGQRVAQGEVLAYARHHTEPFALATQQSQLSELRANRALAEQRVKRLEALEGTVPRKDIDAAHAELKSLLERERAVGDSLGKREALLAPVSGVVSRADVFAGQVVEPRETLFEVIDPARVLVEAITADASLAARIGGAQLLSTPGVSLKLLGGTRSLRDGVLTISFQARSDKPGAPLSLAVGQTVTVIATLGEKTKGIILPATAIARTSTNEPVVWIKSGAERFIPQPVQVRPLDAQTVMVTKGLSADNRVVVQGAPLLSQIR